MPKGTGWIRREARHYCKVCCTWIQGDQKSITLHENAGRHRFNLRKGKREVEKRKEREERQQRFVNRELDRLDRAVVGSMSQKSRDEQSGTEKKKKKEEEQDDYGDDDDDEDYHVSSDQVVGQYDIENVVYLEGNFHQDLLTPGRPCQAIQIEKFVDPDTGEEEDEEVWRDGIINRVKKVVKGSVVCLECLICFGDTGKSNTYRARDVRIVAPGRPPPTRLELIQREEMEKNGWSTVAVRDVVKQEKNQAKQHQQATTAEAMMHNDALATYNPFGGAYKGVDMGEKTVIQQAEMNLGQEAQIDLKDNESMLYKKPKFKRKKRK